MKKVLMYCFLLVFMTHCKISDETRLFTKTEKQGVSKSAADAPVISVINVVANLDLLVTDTQTFKVPLPNADEIIIKKQRSEGDSKSLVWYGNVPDAKGSFVLFSVRGNALSGRIEVNNKFYRVLHIGNGVHQISEIDKKKFDEVDDDGEVPKYNKIDDKESDSCPDPASDIDVMVVYTQSAEDGAGGVDGMQSLIHECLYLTNLAYENSDINQRLRLVHYARVDYTESASSATDRARLQNTSDGFMDNIHALRNTYGADIVLLIVETAEAGNCGRAYIMDPVSSTHSDWAFGVVKRECAADNLSFPHELGHIMSARHHDDASTTPYAYGHGHFNTTPSDGSGQGWETMLSKRSDCDRKIYFSNPDISYSPTGSTTATDPMGTAASADNQSVLNNTASTVANFRCSSPGINNVWMKDTWEDSGAEPDPATAAQDMYLSPYIWVRNVQDPTFLYQHQHNNPEYGTNNWIYVKMHNGGGTTQTGNLEIYIADASVSLTWPSGWSLVGSVPTTINGSSSKIIEYLWNTVPNPASGSTHYCMIARWVSATDPMHTAEGSDINANVRANNNIIWRNLNVVDMSDGADHRVVVNINNSKSLRRSKIVFEETTLFPKPKFLPSGKVTVNIDNALYEAWKSSGANLTGMKLTNNNTFEVSDGKATFDNLVLPPDYKGKIIITFKKGMNTAKSKFRFSVKQYDLSKEVPLLFGGVDYDLVNKN